MAVTRRYQPSHPKGQTATYGMDLSPMLPPGTLVRLVSVSIQTNTAPPGTDANVMVTGSGVLGRRVWVTIEGGTQGQDYLITWFIGGDVAAGEFNNNWIISALLLCAATS